MGKLFPSVDREIAEWIEAQKVFFVATAPKSHDHHINVSPKGHATFTLCSPQSCYYVDLTGSGNETISHLMEKGNSRNITIMFVAFTGPPQIVRLFGKGRVILIDSDEFGRLVPEGDERRLPGARAIVWVDIHAAATSCGYSIPFYEYTGERETLLKFFAKKHSNDDRGKKHDGVRAYWALKNSVSIDDLDGPGRYIGVKYPNQLFTKRIADVSTLRTRRKLPNGLIPGIGIGFVLATLSFEYGALVVQ